MKDIDIYSAIFDITNQNMKDAGKELGFSKDAFMYVTSNNPAIVDVFKLTKYTDNKTFLELAYLNFLKRRSDEKAISNWQGRFSLPSQEFQRLVVNSLIKSQEFHNTCVKAYNNIYSTNNMFGGNISQVKSIGMNMPEKMLKLYRSQPEFLKKLERKIMGIK